MSIIMLRNLGLKEEMVMKNTSKIIAACGNDCLACPRYVAPPYEKTEEQLKYTAQLWMKIGYRDRIVSNDEIACTGCKVENWCRYKVVACVQEKGIENCGQCELYPCDNMKDCFEVTKSFAPSCRQVCTDEEYERLSKAFFEKEKNLNAERVVYDEANKGDIDELVRLRIAYMIDDFGQISEYERTCMETQLPEYFERRLGKELIAFVARAEDRVVAVAYLLVIEKPANPFLLNGFEGEVLSVYTEEAYRGRGICSQLMKNLIEYGKNKGLCRINLMATDEGYPIYKKLGFEDKVQSYRDMRLKI
ncbi:MAG: GNAT family N-acetyltransferase [Lachnospiraceae bacterium]|nr:GNAT family N-acetyltransferase [Lachnospiraceae bacterium]